MRRFFAITKFMLSALAAAMISAGPAHALVNDPLTYSDRTLLTITGQIPLLGALERRDSRRAFQQQQQIYREQDRLMNQVPVPRPEVPVIQQKCPLRVFGNHFVSNCQRN
jgi:hypothetical protein